MLNTEKLIGRLMVTLIVSLLVVQIDLASADTQVKDQPRGHFDFRPVNPPKLEEARPGGDPDPRRGAERHEPGRRAELPLPDIRRALEDHASRMREAEARRLRGWVDMHAHPMAHLAFAGVLIHGAPDVGSILPSLHVGGILDGRCVKNSIVPNVEHALMHDNATHGGPGLDDNRCGDLFRQQVIDKVQEQNGAVVTPDKARGWPDFAHWPVWNDITHQKMYVDWIRRAYDGGLRVMVALAVNNKTLADAVAGPGDGPQDDKASGDLQINEMKKFVGRHRDFMEIAYSADDLRRIVSANKLAIVLGVELDNIGNFKPSALPSEEQIRREIDRLYAMGVRYIFPIHVIDNIFGGTAIYENAFNLSNYREFHRWWDIGCANPSDRITHRFVKEGFDAWFALVKATKLRMDPFREPPDPPNCGPNGHVNRRGLTPYGEFAIREMMRRGMIIDIDHMSQRTVERVLRLAESIPDGGYPLVSGHNGPRGSGGSENSRTDEQYRRIAALRGMAGVGTADVDAYKFFENYIKVADLMGGRAAMGTDLNGLVKAPRPRRGSAIRYDASFPKSRLGDKEWDYNRDGVAHYGLLNEFVRDMRTSADYFRGLAALGSLFTGKNLTDRDWDSFVDRYYQDFLHSAHVFWDTWATAERQKTKVPYVSLAEIIARWRE